MRKQLRQITRRARVFIIALPRRNKNVAFVLEHVQIFAAQIRDVFDGIVKIHVFVVVIAAHVMPNIVIAAHCDGAREQIGAAEQLIRRVIRAE